MGTYENFDEHKQFACRKIADHARATAFALADGIQPGPEGRNYVLRKIMRRAIYHGREHLGLNDLFFYKVCDFVVEQMKDAYPELETQREFIGKMVRLEEEKFANTLIKGMGNFIAEYEEWQSPINRMFKIIGSELENTNYDEEKIQQKLQTYKTERKEKYGEINEFQILAKLSYEYKIPPYLVYAYLESADEMIIRAGKSTFNLRFGKAICSFISKQEASEEQMLLQSIEQQYDNIIEIVNAFLPVLDAYFEGRDDIPLPNFKDFARNFDTFGTPRDLIRVALEERNILIEEDDFNKSFEIALAELQKQSSIGQTERKSIINPIYHQLAEDVGVNKFHGYDTTKVEDAKVIAIVKDDEKVDGLASGDEGLIVLDETPFYAESGGQVGDRGNIFNQNVQINVHDTYAPIAGIVLHKSKLQSGSIKVGDTVTATVDAEKRDATRRNHTATHLVHAALKEVLGTHVKQAGSVVAPNYLRFDFNHYQSLTDAEITEIEDLVNKYILENHEVKTEIMPIDKAKKSGATALFGEKYGSDVRVLSVAGGEFSKELCGGTHVRATGDIGLFKITNDEAIASGVRRIRAITGFDAFERFREDEILIDKSLQTLKTQRDQMPSAIEKLQEELKRTRKEVDDLKMKIATGAIGNVSANGDEAKEISGVKVITKIVEGLDKGGMRHLSDTLLAKMKSGVVVLARTEDDKVSFIVRVSDDLTDKIKAGKIVQEIAPIVGGRGGGKPDMAEGGGSEPEKLSDALNASYESVKKMLG